MRIDAALRHARSVHKNFVVAKCRFRPERVAVAKGAG
jgi:hypothetical protein